MENFIETLEETKEATEDKKEDIDICLNCEYAYCVNCLDRDEGYNPPNKFDWNRKITKVNREFLDYYYLGYTDQEISDKLGLAKITISARRASLGLIALPYYRPRDVRKKIARGILGGRRS